RRTSYLAVRCHLILLISMLLFLHENLFFFFFFSSRRRHTRWPRDWSSDVCSSDLPWQSPVDDGCTKTQSKTCAALRIWVVTTSANALPEPTPNRHQEYLGDSIHQVNRRQKLAADVDDVNRASTRALATANIIALTGR